MTNMHIIRTCLFVKKQPEKLNSLTPEIGKTSPHSSGFSLFIIRHECQHARSPVLVFQECNHRKY